MFGQMDPSFLTQSMFQPQTPPQPNVPQVSSGGMFGGGKFGVGQAIVAALNGYLASTRGPGQEVGLQNMQMMAALRQHQLEHQQSLDDYNRKRTDDNADYASHLQLQAQYREPGEFEQALIASGVHPGTPEWTQAMKTKVQNTLDPPVMTPQGMMLRSQVVGGGGQPAPAGVTFTPLNPTGGPVPQAPGGFSY